MVRVSSLKLPLDVVPTTSLTSSTGSSGRRTTDYPRQTGPRRPPRLRPRRVPPGDGDLERPDGRGGPFCHLLRTRDSPPTVLFPVSEVRHSGRNPVKDWPIHLTRGICDGPRRLPDLWCECSVYILGFSQWTCSLRVGPFRNSDLTYFNETTHIKIKIGTETPPCWNTSCVVRKPLPK